MIGRAASGISRAGRIVSLAAMCGLLAASPAVAQGGAPAAEPPTGQPLPWQIGLQPPASVVADEIHSFYNLINYLIIGIAFFVLLLLVWVVLAYREKANPTPRKTTHNTALEVAWTAIPVLILLVIAVPSFKLLYLQYSFPRPDLTIKAIGNSWYWKHEYPDLGNMAVTSNMLTDEEVLKQKLGADAFKQKYGALTGAALTRALYNDSKAVWAERKQPRLLAVDNEILVPVNKVVHVLVTSTDVIHSWTVPALGSKMDAVPGRITATWFKARREGVFYGQCSELCGRDHAFMPIAVRVVKDDVFKAWSTAVRGRDMRKAREIIEKAAAEQGGSTSLAAAGTPTHK